MRADVFMDLSSKSELIGWPDRPAFSDNTRAVGSRSDKRPGRAGSIEAPTRTPDSSHRGPRPASESAWRGLLSLRDPAGAAHADSDAGRGPRCDESSVRVGASIEPARPGL